MAIKIIKPGKKPEPIHFECKHCGCIFEVDATDYGAHMGGPLSPDYAAMAAATADIIEARLDGQKAPVRTVLPYNLILRESVAAARKS